MISQTSKQPTKEQINKLKVQMNNYDPDYAEMAAKDLCKLIVDDLINMKAPENKEMAESLIDQFLKQVATGGIQVLSSAIRCLAEIVPKLSKEQLIRVFKTTIGSITNPKTESKTKDIFSSSAGEMIERAPLDIGINLADLFVECVNQFLLLSSRKNTKDEEQALIHLLILIKNFSCKWPDVVARKQLQYDRKQLVQVALINIENNSKMELTLKSISALTNLTPIFDRELFEYVFNSHDFGLLSFIRKNEQYNNNVDDLKKLKNGIVCMAQIAHAHNPEMKLWTKQITTICVSLINAYKGLDVDIDNDHEVLTLATEIIEASLDCLCSLLKAYSSELQEWLNSGKSEYLSSFIEDTLNFDMERTMKYLSNEEMEEEQDGYEDEEQVYTEDSVSWKVRQVALSYVPILLRKDNEFKQKKVKQPSFINLLSNKLIQENENVSNRAFNCFNHIIESISTTKFHKQAEESLSLKRVKSTEGNFALQLVENISAKIEILFKHKKTRQQTKTEASKTLLNIIELLNELIKDNEELCQNTLNLIRELLPKVKPDSCINLLKSSSSLLNGSFPFLKAQQIITMYITMVKNTNFKVSAASFDALRNVLKHYHIELLKNNSIDRILQIVIGKLKEHDADKLVKIQTIRCLGPIFLNLCSIQVRLQNEILSATDTKLKVEVDKTVLLNQISEIPLNFAPNKQQQQNLKDILQKCLESVGKANYEESSNAIECCNTLIRILGKTINPKTIDALLQKSRNLLLDSKIPKFLDFVIDNYPVNVKPYAEIIVKTGESIYNEKLINNNIIKVEECLKILKTVVTAQNSKNLSLFVSKVISNQKQLISQINESNWGLVCLGALGYIGTVETISDINNIIESHKSYDFKFEGARAIGNITSRNTTYCTKLIQLSKQPNEGYLYLHALKEMLSFTKTQFPELEAALYFIFEKAENDRETNKHLLAECIGFISRFSPSQLSKILDSIPAMSPARKFIVASSLKHALELVDHAGHQIVDERTQRYIEQIVLLARDPEVTVRESALKSLNSIINSHFDVIRSLVDSALINSLLDSMTIKPELIKIIDYGVNKEKKDLGKGLRIEAFNFVKTVIYARQIEQYYDQVILKCLEKLNEQTSNDLILKRIHIIRVLCQKDSTLFTPYQVDFAAKISPAEGVLKPYANKAAMDDERSEGYLKGLIKQVSAIISLSKENSEAIRGLLNKINDSERLRAIMVNLDRS